MVTHGLVIRSGGLLCLSENDRVLLHSYEIYSLRGLSGKPFGVFQAALEVVTGRN